MMRTLLSVPLCLALLGVGVGAGCGVGYGHGDDMGGAYIGAIEAESTPGQPMEIIRLALMAASDPDEEQGFFNYVPLLHPTEKPTGKALKDKRRHSWPRFRRLVHAYIVPGSNFEFVVARQVPEQIDEATDRVKYFLESVHPDFKGKRMPTPIILMKVDGGWLIGPNSL